MAPTLARATTSRGHGDHRPLLAGQSVGEPVGLQYSEFSLNWPDVLRMVKPWLMAVAGATSVYGSTT